MSITHFHDDRCTYSMRGDEYFTEDEIERMISEIESGPNDTEGALKAYQSVEKRILSIDVKSSARSFRIGLVRVAAALLIPISIITAYLLRQNDEEVQWSEVAVPLGQTLDVSLSDGTLLKINAGGRIKYPSEFDSEVREIYLDGQVRANVSKDIQRPFVIHTNNIDVRVLGTEFELKSYSNSKISELYLFNGSVEMISASGQKSVTVKPGEFVQYDSAGDKYDRSSFSNDGNQTILDTDTFEFTHIEFRDACAELERRFGQKIIITDKELASTKVFAFFSNGESLDTILDCLVPDGIKKERRDGVLYVSFNR